MTRKLTRKDKQELYSRTSKYFEDISKLIFAGAVLSSIMKEDISVWWLIGCGSLSAAIMLFLSYRAYLKSRIS